MVKEMRAMRSSLTPEDRAHADALLLKLGRLEAEQSVGGVATDDASPQQSGLHPAPRLAVPPSAFRLIVFQDAYEDVEA